MTDLWYKQSANVNDDPRWAALRRELGWQQGSACLSLMVVLSGWCKNRNVVSIPLSLIVAEGRKWGLSTRQAERFLGHLVRWGIVSHVPGESVYALPGLDSVAPSSVRPDAEPQPLSPGPSEARKARERERKQAQRIKAKAAPVPGDMSPADGSDVPACPVDVPSVSQPVPRDMSHLSLGHVPASDGTCPAMSQDVPRDNWDMSRDVPGLSQPVPGTSVGQPGTDPLDDAIAYTHARVRLKSSEIRDQREEEKDEQESPGEAGGGDVQPSLKEDPQQATEAAGPGPSLTAPPEAPASPLPVPSTATRKAARGSADAEAVLERWAAVLYPARKPVFDKPRRAVVGRALASFSREQLFQAIDGVARSDWHMGRDPKTEGRSYRDLATIFRDAAQVEKFIDLGAPRPAPQELPPQPRPGPIDRGPRSAPTGPPAVIPEGADAVEIVAALGLFAPKTRTVAELEAAIRDEVERQTPRPPRRPSAAVVPAASPEEVAARRARITADLQRFAADHPEAAQ